MQARRESPYEDAVHLATRVTHCSNHGTASLRSYINSVSELSLGGKEGMGKNLYTDPCLPLSRVSTSLHFLIVYLSLWVLIRVQQ